MASEEQAKWADAVRLLDEAKGDLIAVLEAAEARLSDPTHKPAGNGKGDGP